jgi:hypothetical protein
MIATRLLAALILICLVSTSTDSGPINFNSRIGHEKTTFVWQESLLKKKFNPKCLAPVSPSQQLQQNRCSELIPDMEKAAQK